MTVGMASLEQILRWRETVLGGFAERAIEISVSSEPQPPPATLNLMQPRFFSILSWNIQVFDENKADANPLVRDLVAWVINRLEADVCIMLETRHNPAVNLNAVANAVEQVLGRYHWLSSDMTGKFYRPPKRIGLYGNPTKYFPKFFKCFSMVQESDEEAGYDTWMAVYLAFETLKAYYTIQYLNPEDEQWQVIADHKAEINLLGAVQPEQEPSIYLRLRRCPTCNVPFGWAETNCEGCAEANQQEALQRLYETINQFAFSFSHTVQHESYTLLVRTDPELPSGALTWGDGSLAAVHRTSSSFLKQHNNGGAPGFSDPSNRMYGRSPYCVPLELRYLGQPLNIPLVAFHGPYIGGRVADHQIRRDAVLEIKDCLVPYFGGVFSATENAIVIGDFNLDVGLGLGDGSGLSQKETVAYPAGAGMRVAGFEPKLPRLATSLKTIYSTTKRPKGKKQPLLKDGLATYGGDTADYVSSAYDNVFIKGALLNRMTVGVFVVDVLQSFARALHSGEIDGARYISEDDEHFEAYQALRTKAKAFYLYRRFVSDHLPVMAAVLIDPMTAGDREQVIVTQGKGPVRYRG